MKNNELFLVFTDVVGSTPLDENNKNPLAWRRVSFIEQLRQLLSIDKALALKSIGDALFIIIESTDDSIKRIELCKEILAKTYEAYTRTKDAGKQSPLRKEIKIRAVVHLITGHRLGHSIALSIKSAIQTVDKRRYKSRLLVDSLKKDIFGTEVNKASRIQSLVKDDAILITEEIAKIIEADENKYNDKLDKLTYIAFESKGKNYSLHSPVPVISLKGLSNINYQKPTTVWQLDEDSSGISPVLATEFKSDQMLRLLMTRIDTGITLDSVHEDIHKQVFSLLKRKNNSSKAFNFYNNFIWDVIDQFNIFDIRFTRPLNKKRMNEDDISKEGIPGNFFKILLKDDEYNLTTKRRKNDLLISQISYCSFPSREVALVGRKMLESEDLNHHLVWYTEPQTIDIFKPANLKFSEIDENKGYFILLFFGLYIDHINEANEEDKIFSTLNLSEGSKIKPHIQGLNTGLVDGFVLFKVVEDSPSDAPRGKEYIANLFKGPLGYLLNRYNSGSYRNKDFFSITFPITIFLLKNFDTYHQTNIKNIDCLKKYKEIYDTKNKVE